MYFLLFYTTGFISIFFIKTEWVSSCEEAPLNINYISRYALYNLFIGIPKAKAYLIHYNFFFLLHKTLTIKSFIYFVMALSSLYILFFIINYYIFFIFGVSYLSLYISAKTINDVFSLLRLNYESREAAYQTILLNCFIINSNSVAEAGNKKIIFKNKKVIFNDADFVSKFFSTVKNGILLKNSYNPSGIKLIFANGHYFYFYNSTNSDICVATNFTSKSQIKIIHETITDKGIKKSEQPIDLNASFNPNLKGENVNTFLTNPFWIDMNTIKIGKLNSAYLDRVNFLKWKANAFCLECKDKSILMWSDGKLIHEYNALTLAQFSRLHNISIKDNIDMLEEFERNNKDYLLTKEGRTLYLCVKDYLSNKLHL